MSTTREGQRIPDVVFKTRRGSEWKEIGTKELFAGKRVVVFSLPGAFTPTCSSAQVPRYNELAPSFKAAGIDAILCISVNDGFVMEAWRKAQEADHITFIPDGNGEFTEAMGMLVDKRDLGFGQRSWRYAMVVNDGLVEKMFIEPKRPGDPYGVSAPENVLAYLNATLPPDIVMIGREGCSHCARARRLLQEARLPFAEVPSSPRILKGLAAAETTPQIFIDGKHIGDADALGSWLTDNHTHKRANINTAR